MSREELEERIRALEDALDASEHRYQELLRGIEHMPSGVEIYDHTGVVVDLHTRWHVLDPSEQLLVAMLGRIEGVFQCADPFFQLFS